MSATSAHSLIACLRESAAPLHHALPGDPQRWPRDRSVDLRHLKLVVTLELEAKSVSGTATHTVVPYTDGLAEVAFDAIDMEVSAATVDDKPAAFRYDGAKVHVTLGTGRDRGREVKVGITFRSTPRLGMYFIAPDEAYPDKPVQVWTQGQDEDSQYWFPCYDATNDKQTSEMIVTAISTVSILHLRGVFARLIGA